MSTKSRSRKSRKVTPRRRHCGCSGKQLYIVRTPGKVKATACKSTAEKLVKVCRKKRGNKAKLACTWAKVTVKGGGQRRRRTRRHGRR